MSMRKFEQAFALPTVVITSVILLMLLVGGLSSATSVRRGLTEQYYSTLAREAAEAGIAYGSSCINKSLESGVTTGWGFDGSATLMTGETCAGVFPSGVDCVNAPTADPNQCFIYSGETDSPKTRSSFVIAALQVLGGSVYTLRVTGTVGLYTPTSITPYETHTYVQQQTIATDPHVGVTSGNDTSCSIQYGKLYCWGNNDFGQVGNGTISAAVLSPVLISGALSGKYVHAVATGISHTCAVAGPQPLPSAAKFASAPTVSSKIYCWGSNVDGQYGIAGANVTAPSDARVLNMTDHYATAISGRDRTCIIATLISDPTLRHTYCWGSNNQLQAGRSTNCTTAANTDTPDPKSAFGCTVRWSNATNAEITDTLQINAVTSGSECGVLESEGQIAWCMGNVDQGALGNGETSGGDEARAVRVRTSDSVAITGVTKVATNNGRACALATSGSPAGLPKIFCWGSNWDETAMIIDWRIDSRMSGSQYGWAIQMQTNRSDTTYVFYNRAVSDFAISDWNTCFISAGIVYCSGYNAEGQLGQGHTNGPAGTPSVADGLATASAQVRGIEWAAKVGGVLTNKTVVAIEGGNNHFCAVTSDNNVYCWGANDVGQLGDGTTTNRTLPVQASIPKNIIY